MPRDCRDLRLPRSSAAGVDTTGDDGGVVIEEMSSPSSSSGTRKGWVSVPNGAAPGLLFRRLSADALPLADPADFRPMARLAASDMLDAAAAFAYLSPDTDSSGGLTGDGGAAFSSASRMPLIASALDAISVKASIELSEWVN